MLIRKEDALEYHAAEPAGKVSVVSTKPCSTQRDLSLAYTPGVAVPCLEIERDPALVYKYTAKANLVAVVTNGTAVLGLGNIGAAAGKPVMEGKGVLFKRFADIDVFDIELNTKDPKEIIRACQLMEPTFGGINLEDIKAPECFEIEQELKRTMNIPVFHDDQHGTAIISGAALLNALEIVGKRADQVRVVFNGAGASGIACAEHYMRLGVRHENILMCDTNGVLYQGRTKGMNEFKQRFAQHTDRRTLADALVGADVFFGLSAANCVTPEMLKQMAPDPIVFAMANPDPEIPYDVAVAARPDVIMATGRSDFPNQVNNVLGFPFIFRGALDVRAIAINDEMKLAATRALAALAKEDVPDAVRRAYAVEHMQFGREYIIPTPFDSRVLIWVASAVAQAAMETGVARQAVDLDQYRERLQRRLGKANEITRIMIHKAQRSPRRLVFSEGEEPKILRATQILIDEGIAEPVLIGDREKIARLARDLHLHLDRAKVVQPASSPDLPVYTEQLYRMRQRKGVTRNEAGALILNPQMFGAMMVYMGDADALLGGITHHYPETVRPALQLIPLKPGLRRVAGMYMIITPRGKVYFLADATVNIEPSSEDLAEIALEAAATVRGFDIEPRVAMLSFSNFGSTRHPLSEKVQRAVRIVKQRDPNLQIDGEIQADVAVTPGVLQSTYPFCTLKDGANVLIFPSLEAGNVAYKLLMTIGGCDAIGPILMGMSRPVHVLHRGAEVSEVVNMAALAVVDAQNGSSPGPATRESSPRPTAESEPASA
ncbi:MAG: NADP-dependent malic enzyme [Bryobacterales bacterium]|nr:NADP-dependent malic enzyme [Bryobacterales bacterium]